jgi:eukaryotic-like serine/threonine-protein kinase
MAAPVAVLLSPEPMVTQYGKYVLLKRLALGGMAEIFLARQSGAAGFQKLVVLKRILPQFSSESSFVEMFLDEGRLGATLTHPNIVQIYDLGEAEGAYFIAMEFVAGQDLYMISRKALERGPPVPPAIAARIVANMAEGLHCAHTAKDFKGNALNIVHRDVSPSNVIVSYDGAVKLLDFGIAKAESQTTKTQGGTLKGKYSYMSPEQIRGEPLDGRSDVFALGIVLYESITGRRLYKGSSELSIINAVLNGDVRAPSSLVPEIPSELDSICLKALEKNIKKRYASAQEMQLELERFLASQSAGPASVALRQYMMSLFNEEYTMYQALLAELPTAKPEELAELLAKQRERSGSGSGRSGSGSRSGRPETGSDPASDGHNTAITLRKPMSAARSA